MGHSLQEYDHFKGCQSKYKNSKIQTDSINKRR